MIIGVIGLIGSGKGTVGDILVKKHGFIQESFAKPLKDAISIIFNWDRKLLEGDTTESRSWREQKDEFWTRELGKTITPRQVLQWMGTEAGRNVFGNNLWTSSLINRVDPKKNYVITDVRFENEIKAIRDAGGYLIKVIRGNEPEWFEMAKTAKLHEKDRSDVAELTYLDEIINGAPHIHRSEWDWVNSKMDYYIQNNSTLEKLEDDVNIMVDVLGQIY